MNGNAYLPHEDELVLKHYRDMGPKWCAEQLGRKLSGVYRRAKVLGVAKKQSLICDDQIKAAILELHPQGYTDEEIYRHLVDEFNAPIDRHRVNGMRRRMGLQVNQFSDRQRQRVKNKTQDQLAIEGLDSLAELRRERWNQWKRDLGWPEHLTIRAVQALELFYRHGPLTRLQLCELMGVSPKKRTSPTSNRHGTVLAELAADGLIVQLKKAITVPRESKPGEKAHYKTKRISLYFLEPGVKPNEQTRKRTEAS